jgi:hypothetical protein
MRIVAEDTVTIELTVTRKEAEAILRDFDDTREPSDPGKRLASTLARIVRGEQTIDQIYREKFAKPESVS